MQPIEGIIGYLQLLVFGKHILFNLISWHMLFTIGEPIFGEILDIPDF